MKKAELVGKKYNRLTVKKELSQKKNRRYFLCQCVCGEKIEIRMDSLTRGHTKSCGCLRKEKAIKVHTKHGRAKTTEYVSWVEMKQRCLNKHNRAYRHYGGRGIKVCDRWLNSFENFYIDMGKKPSKNHSIDRIDNNGDYCEENCKFSTPREQANNTRTNKYLFYIGKKLTVAQWSRKLNLNNSTIYNRLSRGYNDEEALEPISKRYLTFNNEKLTIAKWSKKIGISSQVIFSRLKRGWNIRKTLTTKPRVYKITKPIENKL